MGVNGEPAAVIHIEMNAAGQMQVKCNVSNQVTIRGMLDLAKDLLIQQLAAAARQPQIAIPPPGIQASLLRGGG